jgi:hypothetical protein
MQRRIGGSQARVPPSPDVCRDEIATVLPPRSRPDPVQTLDSELRMILSQTSQFSAIRRRARRGRNSAGLGWTIEDELQLAQLRVRQEQETPEQRAAQREAGLPALARRPARPFSAAFIRAVENLVAYAGRRGLCR